MRDEDPPPACSPSKPNRDNAHGHSPAATFPRPAPPARESAAAPEPPSSSPPVALMPSRALAASITIIPARDTASPAEAAPAPDLATAPAGGHGGSSSSQSDGGGTLVARGLEGLEGGAALTLVPFQKQELLSPLECNVPGSSTRPHCVIDCRFCRYVCEGRISPSSGGISPIRSPNRRSPTLIISPRGSPGSEYLLPGLPNVRDFPGRALRPGAASSCSCCEGSVRRFYAQRFL